MIEQFQAADGEEPRIFVLSLKAGGVGLNLTAANHVFHFDRWWNPAVENQATDRAYRMGRKRNVQVHKFISLGRWRSDRRDAREQNEPQRASHLLLRELDYGAVDGRAAGFVLAAEILVAVVSPVLGQSPCGLIYAGIAPFCVVGVGVGKNPFSEAGSSSFRVTKPLQPTR